MNRLHCPNCGRDWYSANTDLTEPCKCGGQLKDMGPAGEDDGLSAARGILKGLLISIPIWAAVAAVIYWIFFAK